MHYTRKILLSTLLTLSSSICLAGDAAAGKARAAACAGCHGPTGVSSVPMYPNLAGQKEAYLVKATKAYKSGERGDPTMKALVGALSDSDIEDIATYYAGQACQ